MPEEQTYDNQKPARIPKLASSVHDISAEKPPFGSRFLTEDSDVWTQNAWDHVLPPSDQAEIIATSLEKQRLAPVPADEKERYNAKPAKYWDNFYKTNADNFFRDRKWLHLEFPELLAAAQPDAGDITICEIGCGAGNTTFPLLSANKNPRLMIRAFDYSSHAVKLVQTNPLYHNTTIGSVQAAVWDLSSRDGLPPDITPESVDIVVLVFVLSALHPEEWRRAVCNIHRMLKPGGVVLIRDYGRYDLTQLRFKSGRLLGDNLYIRGDKTRVYFFELDELALMFTGATASSSQKTSKTVELTEVSHGSHAQSPASSTPPSEADEQLQFSDLAAITNLHSPQPKLIIHPSLIGPSDPNSLHPMFTVAQLGIDRRLLVNRRRQLKMYRVWVQGKFKKQDSSVSETAD